jgi:ABC-type Fe3+ transport system substrate-binding protein
LAFVRPKESDAAFYTHSCARCDRARPATGDRVGSLGKYAFFLAPSSGVLEQFHARGLKFEVIEEFKDIGGYITASFGSLGLMNRAPHPNAAVVFINWLLSKEGQLVWSKAVNAVSRRVDVPTDHLPKYAIPNPKTKYWDRDSEAASVTIPEEKVLTEIFGR